MPSKKLAIETAAATPERAAKPKTPKATVSVKSATPRVRVARHKAATAGVEAPVENTASTALVPAVNRHDEIAKLAYGFWEARGREHGYHEQDWLRAEQEYLLIA